MASWGEGAPVQAHQSWEPRGRGPTQRAGSLCPHPAGLPALGTGKWPAPPYAAGAASCPPSSRAGGGPGICRGMQPFPFQTSRWGDPSLPPGPIFRKTPSCHAHAKPPREQEDSHCISFSVYYLKSRCLCKFFSFPILFSYRKLTQVAGTPHSPNSTPRAGNAFLGGALERAAGWGEPVPAWGLHPQTRGGTDII